MNVSVLINRRDLREAICNKVTGPGSLAAGYATASDALSKILSTRHDLIVIDAKVYPGLGSTDSSISEFATLLPKTEYNENVLYWEACLRVVALIRADDSINRETPIILRVPQSILTPVDGSDALDPNGIERDLAADAHTELLMGITDREFIDTVGKRVEV